MRINILFLESNIKFTKKYKKKLEDIIRESAKQAAKILDLKKDIINFTVYPLKDNSMGTAQANDWIILNISKNDSKNKLRAMVFHEMHHIKKDFCIHSETSSFLDTLFFEGLAIVFQTKQLKKTPEYARYNKKFIQKWLPLLKKQDLSSKDYNYFEWFWGQGKKPKFLGYKLSKYLIDQIQKNYPDLTVIDLTKKKTKDLLKLSKVELK
jgi:uncharacterized protein YjaZ